MVFSQPSVDWFASYNEIGRSSDRLYDMGLDTNCNILATGTTQSGNRSTFLTVKFNPQGFLLWTAIYNGAGPGDHPAMAVDGDGNVYVTGETWGTGETCTTIKYDSSGVQQWVAIHQGSSKTIRVDDLGNVYVGGHEYNWHQIHSLMTLKYNSQGTEQWARNYVTPGYYGNEVKALALDSQRNVIVAAPLIQTGSSSYMTIKYDSAGNQLWTAECLAGDQPLGVMVDDDDNIYMGGWGDVPITGKDFVTVKYNSAGQQQWLVFWASGSNDEDGATAFTADRQGNTYLTGYANYGTFPFESKAFATVKYDAAGQEQWVNFWNSAADDIPSDIVLDDSGNVYVLGCGGNILVVVKYDPSGEQQFYRDYILQGFSGVPLHLGLDAQDNFYLGGTYSTTPQPNLNNDYFILKYRAFTPEVTITLNPPNPPITIPASGGSITFEATVSNQSGAEQIVGVWAKATHLPDQIQYGPFQLAVHLDILDSTSLTRVRTQNVPTWAPAGVYIYRVNVGPYPIVWDSTYFVFFKSDTGYDQMIEGWSCTAEDFPQQAVGRPFISSQLSAFSMRGAYPNPFNPTTAINYQIQASSYVSLKIYDSAGRLVATLVDGLQPAGEHQVAFNGNQFPAGIYFYHLIAGENTATGKMVLLK
jgi:hypothetical protein